MTPAVCGTLALATLGAGFRLVQWPYAWRLLVRLDWMFAGAVGDSFQESRFDESRLSALEDRLARFLNSSAASARGLEGKRAAIQTLIFDISHQTKTPIANILLCASLLTEGELPPEQAAQVTTLSRQAEKLSFLVQALAKISQLETGIITTTPEPQSVGPLLERALAWARPQVEAKGLTLVAEPYGVAVRFDRKQTAEALFNVVDNAVRYIPAGGRVTLSVVPPGQFCRVDMSDIGIGIPEEKQGRIFGHLCQGGAVRTKEGVGTSFYLVRETLRRQGGYARVTSRPGQGTASSLHLPREQDGSFQTVRFEKEYGKTDPLQWVLSKGNTHLFHRRRLQMATLQTRELEKYYSAGDTLVKALDRVELSVENGEFMAIIGASRSDKFTLLHMLGKLDRPTSDMVMVDGRELPTLKDEELIIFRRREIGLMFQVYSLVPVLSVYENIVLPIQLDGGAVDESCVREVTAVLGLEKKLDSLPGQLFGGQQQRVAIVRTLATKPAILLADEPTGNPGSRTSQDVLGLMKVTGQKFARITVTITHNGEIAQLADRIARIEDGCIVTR